MRIVAAVGGRALVPANVESAASAFAEISRNRELVVTHGNGPQAGLLALQSEAQRDTRSYPIDVLGAQAEGLIGVGLERELAQAQPDRAVVTLLTQTVVDALDPAFRAPSVPIGPVYEADDAARLAAERGWTVAPADEGWRRVVAAPVPRSILETPTINLLLDQAAIVVCASGGGMPVVVDHAGARHGVEAVVDRDAASALLARSLGADLLLLLTDVPAVELDWASARARPIEHTTPEELQRHAFAPGSMAPKVAAACSFVNVTGARAAIGALDDAAALVAASAGTQIVSAK
jgi:carbamate kinase